MFPWFYWFVPPLWFSIGGHESKRRLRWSKRSQVFYRVSSSSLVVVVVVFGYAAGGAATLIMFSIVPSFIDPRRTRSGGRPQIGARRCKTQKIKLTRPFFFFFKKNTLPSLPAVARKTEGKVNWFMSAAVWMNISVDSAPRRVCYGLGMRSVSGRKRNCKQRTAAVAGRDGGNGRSVRRIALCAVRRFRFCRPARPIPPRKPLDRVARMKWATKEARKRLGNGRFLVFRTRRLNLFKTSDNLIITQFLTKNRGSAETCEKWSTKTMM